MQRPRTPSRISESLHQRLNSYALAASAAGVGVLALARPAEAKIVYTPADKHIAPHHSFRLDLNHDGKVDFTLSNFAGCGTDQCHYGLSQIPAAAGNSVVGYLFESQLLLASALNRGARIGPDAAFHKGVAALIEAVYSQGGQSTNVLGPWPNVKDRYLGLKFQIHGATHYGWARLNVDMSKTIIKATLTGYAYETIANKPIIAGNTHGKDVITLQETSLGHLARGAWQLGLGDRRSNRRNREARVHEAHQPFGITASTAQLVCARGECGGSKPTSLGAARRSQDCVHTDARQSLRKRTLFVLLPRPQP